MQLSSHTVTTSGDSQSAAAKVFASLSIPSIRDRVVQGALKLILEPIFEADFQSGSYGYRPKRSAHEEQWDELRRQIVHHKTRVLDFDLRCFFDNVSEASSILFEKVARRVDDPQVMHLLETAGQSNRQEKVCLKAESRSLPCSATCTPK